LGSVFWISRRSGNPNLFRNSSFALRISPKSA
jgi:hypothetical protein